MPSLVEIGPLILKKMKMFMPSLVEIGPVVLEKFINVFRNYPPLEKSGALHLNKLESPSPKDALCPVWLKLAHWMKM